MYSKLIKKIQAVLTTDLLKSKYKDKQQHKTTGHCYIAAEALWHLTKKTLFPYVASHDNDTHWWLQDTNGNIFDPTKEQYLCLGEQPPYHKGKRCGFLTKQPSKRCAEIIRRLNEY